MGGVSKFPTVTVLAIGVLLFVGVWSAGALENDAPLTKDVFEQETRLLREEIFNLQQQLLEVRIFQATLVARNATDTVNPDNNIKVCAYIKEQVKAYTALWKRIRDFWPLGNEKIESLDALAGEYARRCER